MLKVLVGVAAEHLVVETLDVVADHQIGRVQQTDELVDVVFRVNQELVGVIAIGDPDRDLEPVHLAPAPDLVEGALGLEVENDDLTVGSDLPLRVAVEETHLSVPDFHVVPPPCRSLSGPASLA